MNFFWLSAEHKVRPDLPNWTSDSLQEKQDGIWHQLLHCTRLTMHPTAAVTSAIATLYWELSACDNWAMVVAACSGQTDGVIWCRCSGVLNTHSSPTRRKYCRHTYTHTQCIRLLNAPTTVHSQTHTQSILLHYWMHLQLPSVLWHGWLGSRKSVRPVKTEWWGAGVVIWSEVQQNCIWPSWCHCHSLTLASVKPRLVLHFWYWLTRVVRKKGR